MLINNYGGRGAQTHRKHINKQQIQKGTNAEKNAPKKNKDRKV